MNGRIARVNKLPQPERPALPSGFGRGTWFIFILLGALHAAVAIYYKSVAGLDILASPAGRTWDEWWQTIPADLLTTDLWRNLFHLHSQPPLFNLYGALFFNLFPGNPMGAMQFSNILLGSLVSGMVFLLLVQMTGDWVFSLVVGTFLALDPALFLFEAYTLYDILTTFWIVAGACLLAVYVRTQRVRYSILFLTTLSMVILTRSVYHFLIYPIGLGLVAICAPRHFRSILLAGVLIGLLPLGWYVKNKNLYGFFGASSWQGFAFFEVASVEYKPYELRRLAAKDVIPRMVAQVKILRAASEYIPFGFQQTSDVPLLSRDDQNNINMIAVSKVYQQGALDLIANDPVRYLHGAYSAYQLFSLPSARFKHFRRNIERIPYHVWFYADVIQGHFLESKLGYPVGSFFFFLVPLSVLVYAGTLTRAFFRLRLSLLEFVRAHLLVSWMVFMIVFTTLISMFFEIGENSREKFYIEYLVEIYLLVIAYRALSRAAHKWKASLSHHPMVE